MSFELINSAGCTTTPDVTFITDDVTYNQLSLQLALTSGSTTMSPGTIPDPSNPPPTTGTTLYVDLSSLALSTAVWDAMTFTGSDWTFQKLASSGVVGTTPTASIPLTSGTSGEIAIGGLTVLAASSTLLVQI